MMGDTRTAKDGFVGSGSLVRLAWTEWSVHHLERGEGGGEDEDDESNGEAGLKNAGPAWAAKQATTKPAELIFSYFILSLVSLPFPPTILVLVFSHRGVQRRH